MGEYGESSSSRQAYPPEVAYGPATPAKPDQLDPNSIGNDWLKNQFDEVVFEETSAKGISFWEGNSGSTSQTYDISGGMYNWFSMDDVETWNSISCRDLLALADATIRKGSNDGGGAEMSKPIGDQDRSNGSYFDNRSNCIDTQQYGWLNLGNYAPDLNLPPQTVTTPQLSTGLSFQFMPVTPDQARRAEHKQMESDIVAKLVAENNKERSNLVEQLQADVSTLVEANQDFEKGLTAETNLNETPQPKQRRRKHRPKVVREGQPKKAKQSPTPPKPDGSSTGKRKYVRKKGVEKSPATPSVGEANGMIDPSTDQQNKKSCRKKINFDETEKGTEVMVEKTEVNITVDKTCLMNQVVETYETILESQSASPITPSKTELPIKDAKHTYRKVKCRINFLQETHDKGPSNVSSPNESNCSTSACFNKGEVEGSKKELLSKIDGMELWDENAIGVGCNLSKLANDNSGSKQGMDLPAIYKKKRIDKCQSSITSGAISSVCSAQASDCSFLAEQNASKAPQMSNHYGLKDDQQPYRCKQAFEHPEKSRKKRSKALALIHDSASFPGMLDGRQWQTPNGASRYEVSHQQQTYMEAHAADFQISVATKKRMKKNSMLPSLYHTKGYIDSLVNQFKRLNINSQMAEEGRDALIPYLSRYNEKNALVLYQERGLVPFEGLFNPVKRRKPRPKVDLDDETSRVWRLLLENINSQGIDGTDEDKAKWWEEERRVFRGRADSFIARMHLVQGDRRFSRWKGSVLDSVVGVFLTQNVSDHLSSSAFMSLAARYPLKSKSSSEPFHDDESILSVKEPCQVDQDETIRWHEEKSNQPSGDHGQMMLQETDPCEEREVVNSNEFSKNSCCVDLNVSSECEVTELSEKDLAMYKESVVDQIEIDDIVSSQNSANMSPSSVQSSIAHTTERLGSCSKEEQKDMSKAISFGGYTSFVELLHMQGTTTVHETYSQQQAEESSNKKIGQDGLESLAYLEEQNDGISPHSNSSGALEVESFEMREERNVIQKKSQEECASEESGLSAESASQAMVQMVKTTSSQEAAKSCNTFHTRVQERSRSRCKMTVNPNINTEQHTEDNNCEVQEVVAIANVSADNSKATESNNIVNASGETVHKVVEINSIDHGTHQIVNGMDEGSSKVKRQKSGKVKQKVEWDNLRLQAEVTQKREKTPNTSDSLDYEAVRTADVNEVADTIKERGMNNVLAARIKDMLDRLVEDHGSIDLEWLRDVPPDKAKEYLLSFRGLGLKSVECVRLLTLHHLAFPVDTNVGRIAVRLGWVPLQPLPESLQLHLLELYPVLESIQKYLWPRLCKLDQRTLYELHYQMITFGKVFCTKSKPNCNACPMRGECRHFASAFASARLGLPAPEERMASLTENRTGQSSIGLIDQCHITLPPASEQLQQLSEVQNCSSGIEEPTIPGTIVEVPATPGPIVEVPTTPGPIIEVPETPGPIIEVPATPEPEPIQEEFDIEDLCEESEEIPMIKLNIEEFTQNLQTYMEKHMVLGEGDMSKALVALTSEAASIPTPKLKNVSQLRTEHQVYELPDSHPLLEGLDTREPDDPCSYLLAIWTPGETADSIQPPEGQCCSQESGTLCSEETCFFCNSTREANSQTVRGTLLIPCRTAMRGSFPLNGTYFQVNEVFADHESSLNPIDVPRSWLWNLPRRTVYFGTSIPTIFKGLTTEDIQYCFWRGFVCVRGFDQKTRAPRPLMARLHFPASRLKRSRAKTDGN